MWGHAWRPVPMTAATVACAGGEVADRQRRRGGRAQRGDDVAVERGEQRAVDVEQHVDEREPPGVGGVELAAAVGRARPRPSPRPCRPSRRSGPHALGRRRLARDPTRRRRRRRRGRRRPASTSVGDGAVVEVQHGLHTVSEMTRPLAPAHGPPRRRGRGHAGARSRSSAWPISASTVGEQALSPVMPEVAAEFGVTEGAVAAWPSACSRCRSPSANLVGGACSAASAPRRSDARRPGVDDARAAWWPPSPTDLPCVVAAQVLLGAGAGLYFPAGLQAVAVVAGAGRRGFAMGIYGVAFSAGLTVAAVLGALGASERLAGAVLVRRRRSPPRRSCATWRSDLGPPSGASVSMRFPVKALTRPADRHRRRRRGVPVRGDPVPHDVRRRRVGPPRRRRRRRCSPSGGSSRSSPSCCRGASSDRRGTDCQRPHDRARRRRHRHRLGAAARAGGRRTPAPPLFAGAVSSFFPVANMVAVDYFGRTVRRSAHIARRRSASAPPPAG